MVGGWSTPRLARFTPGKDTRYTLCRRMDGPRGRSGRVRNISPPPGFDPRNVQLVASRNTDWTIPDHLTNTYSTIINKNHRHYHHGLCRVGAVPVRYLSKLSWSFHRFPGHPMFLFLSGSFRSACLGILLLSTFCQCCSLSSTSRDQVLHTKLFPKRSDSFPDII